MGLYVNFTIAEVATAAVILPVVGAVLVVLRLMGRHLRKIGLGADDWLVLPALLFFIGMGITTVYGIAKKAIGYLAYAEMDEIFRERYSVANAVFYHDQWLQILTLGCIKLSFLFFYRRVFVVNPKAKSDAFNVITIGVIILTVAWTLAFFLAAMLMCPGHMSAFWASGPGRTEPSPTRALYCWPTKNYLYVYTWTDMIMDLIIFILPIHSIIKLQLSLKRKLGVLCIFLLGAITVAASTIRAAMYIEFLNIRDSASYDDNMLNTNGVYWMLVETGLAMIVVNLPPLYAFFRHERVGAVLRQVRSFVSLRSDRSASEKSGENTAFGSPSSDSSATTPTGSVVNHPKHISKFSRSSRSSQQTNNNIIVTHEVSLTSTA